MVGLYVLALYLVWLRNASELDPKRHDSCLSNGQNGRHACFDLLLHAARMPSNQYQQEHSEFRKPNRDCQMYGGKHIANRWPS